MSAVAYSIALRVLAKSTPRSKRYDESVLKPNRRALPAITNGAKKALSKKISVVSLSTEVGLPPMMPASAIAPDASAITKSSAFNCTF